MEGTILPSTGKLCECVSSFVKVPQWIKWSFMLEIHFVFPFLLFIALVIKRTFNSKFKRYLSPAQVTKSHMFMSNKVGLEGKSWECKNSKRLDGPIWLICTEWLDVISSATVWKHCKAGIAKAVQCTLWSSCHFH